MGNRRKILPYRNELVPIAKKLRKNMTLAEVLLRNELKQGKMWGNDFDRQKPIGQYIVDFNCKDFMLAIEVDGQSHDFQEVQMNDIKRQRELEDRGVRFLRFGNRDIKTNMPHVLKTIENWIEQQQERQDPLPGRY